METRYPCVQLPGILEGTEGAKENRRELSVVPGQSGSRLESSHHVLHGKWMFLHGYVHGKHPALP